MEISVEIQDAELRQAIERLRYKTGNLQPFMREVAETLRTSVEQNFKQESSRSPIGGSGGAWKDLAPSTKKARAKKGKTGRKLQVTGQLLASISTYASSTEAAVGTNKKYARFLNDGTKRMPARPFFVVQQADIAEIQKQAAEHFTGF